MTSFPMTDIVADVARAADPNRQTIAMRRLSLASRVASPSPNSFELFASDKSPVSLSALGQKRSMARTLSTLPPSTASTSMLSKGVELENSSATATRKFEAMVLATIFDALLPKDGGGGFGAAGGVWRSMLAEQLGTQFVTVNSFGLRSLFDKTTFASSKAGPSSPIENA